jgi:hypothetical protein
MTENPGQLDSTTGVVFLAKHCVSRQSTAFLAKAQRKESDRFSLQPSDSKPVRNPQIGQPAAFDPPHGSPSRIPASEYEPTILLGDLLSPVGATIRGSSTGHCVADLAEQQSG